MGREERYPRPNAIRKTTLRSPGLLILNQSIKLTVRLIRFCSKLPQCLGLKSLFHFVPSCFGHEFEKGLAGHFLHKVSPIAAAGMARGAAGVAHTAPHLRLPFGGSLHLSVSSSFSVSLFLSLSVSPSLSLFPVLV